MIKFTHCSTDSDYCFALKITEDYVKWLKIDLEFQDINKELKNFHSVYGPPKGLYLLAWSDNEIAGGAGLRMLEGPICEMKRLFVYDRFRCKGIGRMLCTELINEAQKLGYKKMRLDTLSSMSAAISLYDSLGFKVIEAYRFNPDPYARFMELNLENTEFNKPQGLNSNFHLK